MSLRDHTAFIRLGAEPLRQDWELRRDLERLWPYDPDMETTLYLKEALRCL